MLPLSDWANGQLGALARQAQGDRLAELTGAQLMGERAALKRHAIPGAVSAGGGCRLYPTKDGHVALTLARDCDRDMMPALFRDAAAYEESLPHYFAQAHAADVVEQGRLLGLAIARLGERPASRAHILSARGPFARPQRDPLRVVDLSTLWAGPLAAHLLQLTGAHVIKVESPCRPDRMRQGEPALFARINQDKDNVAIDPRTAEGRDALVRLIQGADIVIESARLRALPQLGIDPDRIVRDTPGLVWLTITGHGATGDAAGWIGFGDDCSVAGGLSDALQEASGTIGFGGDACADPLTGLYAARLAFAQRMSGNAARIILSMSGTVAQALADMRASDEHMLMQSLQHWAASRGHAFPAMPPRPHGPVAALGADNAQWLGPCTPC